MLLNFPSHGMLKSDCKVTLYFPFGQIFFLAASDFALLPTYSYLCVKPDKQGTINGFTRICRTDLPEFAL